MLRYTRLLLLFFTVTLPFNITAQIDHVKWLDSLYWDGKYDTLLEYAAKELKSSDLENYQRIGMLYYTSLTKYRRNDFTGSSQVINDIYEEMSSLDPEQDIHAQLMIDICQRIGDFGFITRDYEKGVKAMDFGISLAQEYLPKDHWRAIKLLHKNGAVLRVKGDLPKSKQNLDLALNYLDSLTDRNREYITPAIKSEIAAWHDDNHKPKYAIQMYEELLQQAEVDSNYRRINIYNNNIGIAYEKLGDFGKAIHYMQNSIEAISKIYTETSPKLLSAYHNLTKLYIELDDWENADKYWDLTEELIYKSLGDDEQTSWLAILEMTKGKAYLYRKDYQQAIAHFTAVEAMYDDVGLVEGNDFSIAMNLNGFAYSMIEEYDKGIHYLKKSIGIRNKMGLKSDYLIAKSQLYLHKIYQEKNQFDLASKFLNDAFETISVDINDTLDIKSAPIPNELIPFFTYTLNSISYSIDVGQDMISQGETVVASSEELVRQLRFSIDDYESKANLHGVLEPLNAAISHFYLKSFEFTSNQKYLASLFEIQEKANNTFLYQHLAENKMIKHDVPLSVIEEKNKYTAELNEQKQKVHGLKLSGNVDSENYIQSIEELNNRSKRLFDKFEDIKKNYPQYYELVYNYPIVSLEETQLNLENDEFILQYFISNENVYCLLIGAEKVVPHKVGDQKSVADDLTSLIECVVSKNDCALLQQKLYQKLIGNLQLQKGSVLHLVPGSIFGNLPFEILQDENNNYLLEKYQFNYQFSSTLKLLKDDRRKRNRNILAMAPVFEEDEKMEMDAPLFASLTRSNGQLFLPFSKKEVSSIEGIFNTTAITNSAATVGSFLEQAPKASIIHLATHGIVNNKNPNQSLLLFSSTDSIQSAQALYANEIVNLDLSADLVTLSACNTGTGKIQAGEGVSSLGRAFAYAGCPNQVISLWAVNDYSTTELMSQFYKNLKAGMTKPQAIQDAKLHYLKSSPQALRHPYYWAGFVYYGNDLPIGKGGQFSNYAIIAFLLLGVLFLLWRLIRRIILT